MNVYCYTLLDQHSFKPIMSTELDEPDLTIDQEFWQEFMKGESFLVFTGTREEE